MNAPLTLEKRPEVVYPDSDGKPMADNTKQLRWIFTIEGGLDALFADQADVFVAGDLLWYPVEGQPSIRVAPDALVVFGRPKGDRGSYMQWKEAGIAPQVVFEIWSPGNNTADLLHKLDFYQKYGVEEFYFYDPDDGNLLGFLRQGNRLEGIVEMQDWVSPRLGVRFTLENDELVLYRPDGKKFLTYVELWRQNESSAQRAEAAEAEIARLRALLEKN